MCVRVFIYIIHISVFTLSHGLFKFVTFFLFYFYIDLTHFVEKTRIQNTENSKKENLEKKRNRNKKRSKQRKNKTVT